MRGKLSAGIVIALLVAPGPAAAQDTVVLSDQRARTTWAHAEFKAPAYEEPSVGSRLLARLHLHTEDRLPEVYLVLRSLRDENRRLWYEIRVPRRDAPPSVWVRPSALSKLRTVRTRLVIDRSTLLATFYKRGRAIWRARVGIGAPSTPTPAGQFWVREVFRVAGGGGGPYGPFAFGTSAYSVLSDWPGGGVVGIHGTNQPGLIPGRPSHGCIRLRNRDIRWLAWHMPIGTPLEIR